MNTDLENLNIEKDVKDDVEKIKSSITKMIKNFNDKFIFTVIDETTKDNAEKELNRILAALRFYSKYLKEKYNICADFTLVDHLGDSHFV